MGSQKRNIGVLIVAIVVLLGLAISLLAYSNKDNTDNSLPNTQPLSTGNRYLENFYDKPITDETIALDAIETNRSKLGYNDENISFEFITENGYLGSSYRFRTLYKQIPIDHSTIIVTTYSDNKPKVLIYGDIELSKLEKLDTTSKITQDEALNIAKEILGENFSEYNGYGNLKENVSPKLIIYKKNGEYLLAYYIETGLYVCVINAENGDVILSQNTSTYSVAEYKGQNGDIQQIFYDDLDGIANALYNKEKRLVIFDDVVSGKFAKEKLLSLEDIQSGKNKSAVDAMANTYKAIIYFEKFGTSFNYCDVQVNDTDELESKMLSKTLANSRLYINSEGATYSILNFGTKNIYGIQYSAYLDIVAHEYTHNVTKLKAFGTEGYSEQFSERNALMEAYSDIFGELVEHEYTGKTDWKPNGDNSQNLKNPKIKKYSKRKICTTATKDNDYGYAHKNCDIISHAAYLMSKSNGNKKYDAEFLLDFEQLGKLWYGSLEYLDEKSDFSDCRLAIEQSARDLIEEGVLLEANLDIIKQAFDEVEVKTDPARHSLQDGLKVADNQDNSISTTQTEPNISIGIKTEPETENPTIASISTEGIYGDFQYKLEENEIIITGLSSKDITSIEIPSEIYGYPVTAIDDKAFYYSEIESAVIPDSIMDIGFEAFGGTPLSEKSRKGISTIIGNGILIEFNHSGRTPEIVVPDGVRIIAARVFSDDLTIRSVELPESLECIGRYAFLSCKKLDNVEIPDKVAYIGFGAFYDCGGLNEISIPEKEMYFGGAVFDNTRWLVSRQYENPESRLVIINNNIIDGEKCEGEVIVPNNITEIPKSAFSNSSITSIVIPDSVKKIKSNAFIYCDLTSVTIPKECEIIGEGAFSGCDALQEITILNPNCQIIDNNDGETISNKFSGGRYDGIIKGYKNSTAQEYAEKYGYEFIAIDN